MFPFSILWCACRSARDDFDLGLEICEVSLKEALLPLIGVRNSVDKNQVLCSWISAV